MSPPNEISPELKDREILRSFHSTWPIRVLPDGLKPYGELLRLHRPAGIMMFYLPCMYGTFLVGSLGFTIPPLDMVTVNVRLLLLSFLMRSALVAWNDMIDVDIDRQVQRTRIRPLARGAISVSSAAGVTAILMAAVLATFHYLLPARCLAYSSGCLALHVVYPWTKRATHHPQAVLGVAYTLGVLIAFPAFKQALPQAIPFLTAPAPADATAAAICIGAASMCLAIFLWTVLNDTIYAAQDLADDRKAGVGSPMIYWGRSARGFLRVLAGVQLLALAGVAYGIAATGGQAGGAVYATLTGGCTAAALLSMVEFVDLESPESCAWWFNKGNLLVGYAMGSGLVGEYLADVFRAQGYSQLSSQANATAWEGFKL